MITRRGALAGGLGVIALTACSKKEQSRSPGGQGAQTAGVSRSYKDVQEVASVSNAFLVGRFQDAGKVYVDDGGLGSGEGPRVTVRTFAVDQSNPKDVPKSVMVALTESENQPPNSSFAEGETYAFFVEKLGKADRGGLQELGDLYTPRGNGHHLFVVEGDQARAMTPDKSSKGSYGVSELITLKLKD